MVELWASRLDLDGLFKLMSRSIKFVHAQVNVSFIVEDIGVTWIDLQGRFKVIKSISLSQFVT